MLPTPCDTCHIRAGCDWLSESCRLSPAQVVAFRPDLIRRVLAADKPAEAQKQATKRYLKRHPERRRETERVNRETHRDAIQKRQKTWWEQNKDRINKARRPKRRKAMAATDNGERITENAGAQSRAENRTARMWGRAEARAAEDNARA